MSRGLRPTAALLVGLPGLVVAVQSGYLAALSAAALRPRPGRRPPPPPTARLAVLVPAHDEQELIGRCLASLADQRYPVGLRRTVVIADNCTDRTAEIARAAGAEVLERHDPASPGKGQALRWAMDRLLREDPQLDAVVVVDADSIADPDLLGELAAALTAGAAAVQAEYLALTDDGPTGELRDAAFLLFHRVRFRGRAALGLPCSLVGNGMLFSRRVLEEHPWQAFSSTEDLEHSLDLRIAGVRPVFAERARLRAPVASDGAGARTQRLRWEGGRLELVRTRLPGLLVACLAGRPDLWDAALDLAVPPLGVLAPLVVLGASAAGVLVAAGTVGGVVLLPWAVAAAALPAHVLVGLRAAGAPPSTYAALRGAPALVASQALARLSVLRDRRAGTWVRTERPGAGPGARPADAGTAG